MKEKRIRDVATNAFIPDILKNRQQYTHIRVRRSSHTHVASSPPFHG